MKVGGFSRPSLFQQADKIAFVEGLQYALGTTYNMSSSILLLGYTNASTFVGEGHDQLLRAAIARTLDPTSTATGATVGLDLSSRSLYTAGLQAEDVSIDGVDELTSAQALAALAEARNATLSSPSTNMTAGEALLHNSSGKMLRVSFTVVSVSRSDIYNAQKALGAIADPVATISAPWLAEPACTKVASGDASPLMSTIQLTYLDFAVAKAQEFDLASEDTAYVLSSAIVAANASSSTSASSPIAGSAELEAQLAYQDKWRGDNYAVGDLLLLDGFPATVSVDSVVGSEALREAAIRTPGAYTMLPSLERVRATGSKIDDAALDLVVTVADTTVAVAGSGYLVGDELLVQGGNTTVGTATGTTIVEGGTAGARGARLQVLAVGDGGDATSRGPILALTVLDGGAYVGLPEQRARTSTPAPTAAGDHTHTGVGTNAGTTSAVDMGMFSVLTTTNRSAGAAVNVNFGVTSVNVSNHGGRSYTVGEELTTSLATEGATAKSSSSFCKLSVESLSGPAGKLALSCGQLSNTECGLALSRFAVGQVIYLVRSSNFSALHPALDAPSAGVRVELTSLLSTALGYRLVRYTDYNKDLNDFLIGEMLSVARVDVSTSNSTQIPITGFMGGLRGVVTAIAGAAKTVSVAVAGEYSTIHHTLYTHTLYTIHSYTIHYTLYTIHYTLYTIHYTLYRRVLHHTLYTIHYTLYTHTLYTIQASTPPSRARPIPLPSPQTSTGSRTYESVSSSRSCPPLCQQRYRLPMLLRTTRA
jgi:hypothetical protein